jgi:parallel beta-helix repeat protein
LRRPFVFVAALCTVVAVQALTAGSALASHVQCGDTITQDTTLDSDLLGCAYPALTVAGDHVTLDLNQHVVEGGVQTPLQDSSSFTGLVIENGTVRGGGISLTTYEDVMIQHLTVDGIGVGPDVNRAQIAHNIVRGSSAGVDVHRSGGVTISGNLIERSGTGIGAAHAGVVTVIGNTIRANELGIGGGQGGDFVAVANKIVGNRGNGVWLNESSNTTLRDNLIAANGGDGVHAEFVRLSAEHNTISRNGHSGVFAAIGEMELTGNTASQNVEDGIRIGERAGAALTDNSTDRNGDDGIDVDEPAFPSYAITLTRNHTWFNGDLGIEAHPDTVGGANWAKHNGNPAQCMPASLCSTNGKPKG